MKKILLLVSFIAVKAFAQQPVQLFSPDKAIHIDVQTKDQLAYSVFVDGKRSSMHL